MKKTFRRILSGVVAAALSLTVFALPAAAAEEEVGITFTADQEIVFDENGEDGLFPAFQDLYPGDVREQEIYLRNTSSERVTLSLRILPSEKALEPGDEELVRNLLYGIEENGEHIDLLHMTIYNGSTKIYEGTAAGPVEEGIPLGWIRTGYGAPLRVELAVDGANIGNEYQDLLGYIDWELVTSWEDEPYVPDPSDPDRPDPDSSEPDEEISDSSTPTTSVPETSGPSGPSTPGGEEEIDDGETPLEPFPEQDPLPQTGDNFPLYIAIGGAVLCAAVVVAVLLTGNKRKHVK